MFARIDTDIVGCLEHDFIVRLDGYLLARLRILTLSCRHMPDRETAEVGNGNVAVAFRDCRQWHLTQH